jgi:hypothetical protein
VTPQHLGPVCTPLLRCPSGNGPRRPASWPSVFIVDLQVHPRVQNDSLTRGRHVPFSFLALLSSVASAVLLYAVFLVQLRRRSVHYVGLVSQSVSTHLETTFCHRRLALHSETLLEVTAPRPIVLIAIEESARIHFTTLLEIPHNPNFNSTSTRTA